MKMWLQHAEAVSPNPNFFGVGVLMPVMNDRATMLIDEDLEIAVTAEPKRDWMMPPRPAQDWVIN